MMGLILMDDSLVSKESSGQQTFGFLTKGDNSPLDDTVLYPRGHRYLFRRDIVGSVKGYIPYIGQLALVFGDFLWLKYGVLAISAFVCVYGIKRIYGAIDIFLFPHSPQVSFFHLSA